MCHELVAVLGRDDAACVPGSGIAGRRGTTSPRERGAVVGVLVGGRPERNVGEVVGTRVDDDGLAGDISDGELVGDEAQFGAAGALPGQARHVTRVGAVLMAANIPVPTDTDEAGTGLTTLAS